MNTDAMHPLAAAYLQELEARARQLPPDQAQELIADIREHVSAALRPDSAEAEVREALDRLGSPAEVVAAAGPPVAAAPPTGRGMATAAIVCLVLAELLFILWPLGLVLWMVGVVLLAVTGAWTAREKVLGAVGLASGFPLVGLVLVIGTGTAISSSCTGTAVTVDGDQVTQGQTCQATPVDGSSDWVVWVFLAIGIAYLAFQAYTIWRLTRAPRTA